MVMERLHFDPGVSISSQADYVAEVGKAIMGNIQNLKILPQKIYDLTPNPCAENDHQQQLEVRADGTGAYSAKVSSDEGGIVFVPASPDDHQTVFTETIIEFPSQAKIFAISTKAPDTGQITLHDVIFHIDGLSPEAPQVA
jgi:hypothetical protein